MRLHLGEFFLDNEEQSDHDDVQPHFRPPSTLVPPNGGETVLMTYFWIFRVDIKQHLDVN